MAAVGMRGLQIATGVIGVAITAFMAIFAAQAESTRQAEQATNDYADALRASNGALDESIAKVAAKKLQDEGALDAAKRLGLSLEDVTQAALGNAGATDRVTTALAAQKAELAATGAESTAWSGDVKVLTGALDLNNVAIQGGIQKNRDLTAATGATTATVDAASTAYTKAGRAAEDLARQAANIQTTLGPQAQLYSTTATALDAYYQGQRRSADATETTTLKMFMESDAAGILRGALDALNGKALNAAQAQNAFDSSLVNMGDHITTTGSKVTFTTTSINDMSAASVALRGQLNGQIRNLEQVAEANGGLANSTGAARDQLFSMREQIIKNAVAHGVDREAVTKYVDGLLKIPKEIPPTKLDVDKAAAQKKIDDTNAELKAVGLQRPVPVIGADIAQAMSKMGSAKVALMDLDRTRPNPLVDTNIVAALGKIGSAKVALMDLDRTNPSPTVTANTGSAMAGIGAVQSALNNLSDRSITIRTNTIATRMDALPSANGNIFKSFAAGGFNGSGENHVAQIAPAGAMRMWAESETGGEAYIPLAPSKRARSTAIWEETGRLLGAGGGEGIDYQRLASTIAAAMSRVVLRPTISAGSFDLAMGAAV